MRPSKTTWRLSSIRLGARKDYLQFKEAVHARAFNSKKDIARLCKLIKRGGCLAYRESWSSPDLGYHEAYNRDSQLVKNSPRRARKDQEQLRRNTL